MFYFIAVDGKHFHNQCTKWYALSLFTTNQPRLLDPDLPREADLPREPDLPRVLDLPRLPGLFLDSLCFFSFAFFCSFSFLALPFSCFPLVLGRLFFVCSLPPFGFLGRFFFAAFFKIFTNNLANASAPGISNAEFWEDNSFPLHAVLMKLPMSPTTDNTKTNTTTCS